LNIYPENFKEGLSDSRISKFVSGNSIGHNNMLPKNRGEVLDIQVELGPGVKSTAKLKEKISNVIVENLRKVNIEYNKTCHSLGKRALPHLTLLANGKIGKTKLRTHSLLSLNGKKPKMYR